MRPPLGLCKTKPIRPTPTERSHHQPLPKTNPTRPPDALRPAARRCKTKPIRPAPSERSHHQAVPNEPNAAARRLGPSRARRCKTKPIPSGAYQTKPSPALSNETCMSAVSRLFSPSGIKTQPSAPPPGHSKKRTHCGAGQRKQRRCFSLSEYFSEEPNAARRTPRTRPRTVAKQSQSASDPYQTKPIARRQPARLAPPWRSACSSNSHPVTKGN